MNRSLRLLTLLVALLLCLGICSVALANEDSGEAEDLTAACGIILPEALANKAYRITDSAIESYQAFTAKHTLEIDLPADLIAQGVYFEWYTLPNEYTLEQYDSSGALVSSSSSQPFVNCYYQIEESVTVLKLAFYSDAELSTVRVYGEGALPLSVQLWQQQPDTADLLLIASTPQAAVTDFFGVLASYTVEHQIPTALVVLAKDTRTMQEGLLAGLWKLGITSYPRFGSFVNLNSDSYKRTRGEWGVGASTKFIQSVLGQYGARVVLTHSPGEDMAYDAAAQYCAEVVQGVLESSAKDYPSVQKLYLANPEGATTLNYETPLIAYEGNTALAAANEAYAENPGMRIYHKTLQPTAVFTLDYTTVGDDSGAGDLLENIDTATLANYIVLTPSPTPTLEPTPQPTAQPTQAPSDWGSEEQQSDASNGALERYMLYGAAGVLLIGLVIGIVIAVVKGRYFAARYGIGRAVLTAALPLAIAAILAAAFLLFLRPVIRGRLAAQTVASATAEPAATPEATPEPAQQEPETQAQSSSAQEAGGATGTDAADSDSTVNDDSYYRAAGDPEEVVITDGENGHWEYRTDTLSIIIDRKIVTEPKLNRIYVAEIRMRGEDSFRTVQAAENRNGMGSVHPWLLARDYKTVLLITGDNLIQSDELYKGIIIRGGIVFQDRKAVGSMAMYPDLTMRLIAANSATASDLLQDGARDVFSFGPVLVSDGTVNDAAAQHRLSRRNNPRTGIGMIEPGHYIAIVVDGRQPDYSVGMLLDEFAQLFVDYGCETAYNLDGGVSACMVFMGEQLNRHGNKRVGTYEDSYQRRVPDGLAWGYSELVPDSDDPIYNTGTSENQTP